MVSVSWCNSMATWSAFFGVILWRPGHRVLVSFYGDMVSAFWCNSMATWSALFGVILWRHGQRFLVNSMATWSAFLV